MDVFGFIQLAITGSQLVLYTCPIRASLTVGTVAGVTTSAQDRNTQTQVTSIIITNSSGGPITFDMWLTDLAADTPTATNLILSDYSVAADETVIFAQGLVLAADNTIWIQGSGTGMSATLNKIEVS